MAPVYGFAKRSKENIIKRININNKKYRKFLAVALRYCAIAAGILAVLMLLVYGYNYPGIREKFAD